MEDDRPRGALGGAGQHRPRQIDGYDVQHRVAASAGAFTDSGHAGTATSHRIENLAPGTAYEVRVRARERRGPGASGPLRPPRPPRSTARRPFRQSLTSSGRIESPENARQVGSAAATDPDAGDAVTYALSGPDASLFSISVTGALAFLTPPDFESPLGGAADDSNDHRITVAATGGTGQRAWTATLDLVVAVTDENEPPPRPGCTDRRGDDGDADRHELARARQRRGGRRSPNTTCCTGVRDGDRFQNADHDGTDTTVTIAGPAAGGRLRGAGAGAERRGPRRLVGRGDRRHHRSPEQPAGLERMHI